MHTDISRPVTLQHADYLTVRFYRTATSIMAAIGGRVLTETEYVSLICKAKKPQTREHYLQSMGIAKQLLAHTP
jgi:hypothetical protein